MIDLYASAEHYFDHLAPIWRLLQQREIAHRAYSARSGQHWREATLPRPSAHRGTQPVIVASYVDYQRTHPAAVVYVEHGAGQTYNGDLASKSHPSYSGGVGLDRVMLFITPAEHVAARWRRRYIGVPAVAVGCPKLDLWHAGRVQAGARDGSGGPDPTVAVTFHWDCPLVPETLSAWRHYDHALAALVRWASEHHVELLGHGHPRIWRRLEARWRQLGVEPVARLDEVLDRADVLVADNSSSMFEFASLDRPVVVLNAPWYRRDVDHGGRFWSWADVGVQCDQPAELIGAVEQAIVDEPAQRASRQRIVSDVYAHRDGHAAERAADAIVEVLHRADEVHREQLSEDRHGF